MYILEITWNNGNNLRWENGEFVKGIKGLGEFWESKIMNLTNRK